MDDHRNNVETQFADAGLALLMDWSAESDGELLWEEYCSGEYSMPPELDIRCCRHIQKLIKKQRWRTLVTRTLKSAGKFAACFAIMILLTVSLIVSVEALRVPVLNFFLKHSDRATSIMFQQVPTHKQTQLEELLNILKTTVPEGYRLELEKIYRNEFTNPPVITSVFLAFQDAQDTFLMIEVNPAEGTWNIDTEDATLTRITLEDQKAILIEKSPEIRVLWLNETQGLFYSVTANSMEKTDFMEYVTILAGETRYSNAGLAE